MRRYNSKSWVLCLCRSCGRPNYVEPHGTTAKCRCSDAWTEHESIPYRFGDLDVDTRAARKVRS